MFYFLLEKFNLQKKLSMIIFLESTTEVTTKNKKDFAVFEVCFTLNHLLPLLVEYRVL